MKNLLFTFAWLACTAAANAQEPLSAYDMNKPFGWAMVDGTITGGEGGVETVVTTEAELQNALLNNESGKKETGFKRIIYIKGAIEITQPVEKNAYHVQNKTILGLPGSKLYSKTRTAKNGGVLKFTTETENIIIRNVTFEGPGAFDVDGEDALLLQGCKRVWIDHCDFLDGMDSSFDCNNGSDNISVTWTRFRYLKEPLREGYTGDSKDGEHRYCCTWGASDSKGNVSGGHLNTTFANCWWGEGCIERCPRVRFGKVHVVNCYFTNTGNGYCLGYGYQSNIYADRCWFADGVKVSKNMATKKGYLDYNFQIVDCHNAADVKEAVGDGTYYTPSEYYDYAGFSVDLVPTVVGDEKTGAGANLMVEVGKGVTGYADGSAVVPEPEPEPEPDGIVGIENGTVRNGDYYNLAGQKTGKDYEGILIHNGKKIVNKK